MMIKFKELIQPFGKIAPSTRAIIAGGWIVFFLVLFEVFHSPLVPPPSKIGSAFIDLIVSEDFWDNFLNSIWTTMKAMVLSIILTMIIVYASTIPLFKVFAVFTSKCRYLTLTGLVTLFTFLLQGGNMGQLKMSLLIFGIVPYFTTSFLSVVQSIPQQQIDKSYVNRNNSWQTLFEIVIVGRFDQLFEVMRQNFAISWMMITMVESLAQSEGGIGVMIVQSNKHLVLAPIFAMLLSVLLIGILFDWGIRQLRFKLFPYLKK
jgi:ABC-type nitrate/sulfonate/bicarbonate transport system permease component